MGKTIQISRYRNGQVRERIPLQGGVRHGRVQTWHRNGVASSEEFYVNGRLHGIGRQWDETGKLLGEFTADQGTGFQREWHDTGRIKVEVSLVAGKFCGPSRIWLRDGTLLSPGPTRFADSVHPGGGEGSHVTATRSLRRQTTSVLACD